MKTAADLQNCLICRYRRNELGLVRCDLGMFEEIDLEEAYHSQRDLTLHGRAFYRVGTLSEDIYLDYSEKTYSDKPSRRFVEDVMRYWNGWHNIWEIDLPDYLFDEEDVVTDEFYSWVEEQPEVVTNALLGRAWTDRDFEEHNRFIGNVLKLYSGDQGYTTISEGADAAKLVSGLEDTSCIYGMTHNGQPFYKLIKEEGLAMRNKISKKEVHVGKVFTIQKANAKKMGVKSKDITYKKKDIWSPSQKIVMYYKKGKINKEVYTEKYIKEMRDSYKNRKAEWDSRIKSIADNSMVIDCYCGPKDFCHRFVLAKEILPKLGVEYGGEIESVSQARELGLL